MVAWCLFGVTAKNGNVDDVRSWLNPEHKTMGTIVVETQNNVLTINRSRGRSNENDLYWQSDMAVTRGKDLSDTQRQLDATLGVNADLFLPGAYVSEFSNTSSFFITNAAGRRKLLDNIVSLEFPISIVEAAAAEKKRKSADLKLLTLEEARRSTVVSQIQLQLTTLEKQYKAWGFTQQKKIEGLKLAADNFEANQNKRLAILQEKNVLFEQVKTVKIQELVSQIDTLRNDILRLDSLDTDIVQAQAHYSSLADTKCEICGGPKDSSFARAAEMHLVELRNKKFTLSQLQQDFARAKGELSKVQARVNTWEEQIRELRSIENHYVADLASAQEEKNPIDVQIEEAQSNLVSAHKTLKETRAELSQIEQDLINLDKIRDLSSDLRGILLKNAVQALETDTNSLFNKYFDSELRIALALPDADEVELTIFKDSYECHYRQLSKGQRGLLKLCFALAVMKASADNAGVHFANLFFDEALDGLDSTLKTKAYSLFEDLQNNHSSIWLIDHAQEFQTLFSHKMEVSTEGGLSTVTRES